MTVSTVYEDARHKRAFVFNVRKGDRVDFIRFYTREEAEAAREEILRGVA